MRRSRDASVQGTNVVGPTSPASSEPKHSSWPKAPQGAVSMQSTGIVAEQKLVGEPGLVFASGSPSTPIGGPGAPQPSQNLAGSVQRCRTCPGENLGGEPGAVQSAVCVLVPVEAMQVGNRPTIPG